MHCMHDDQKGLQNAELQTMQQVRRVKRRVLRGRREEHSQNQMEGETSNQVSWFFFGQLLTSWNTIQNCLLSISSCLFIVCCSCLFLHAATSKPLGKINLWTCALYECSYKGRRQKSGTFGQKSTIFCFCFNSMQKPSKRVKTQ